MEHDLFARRSNPTKADAVATLREHLRKLEQLVMPINTLRPPPNRPDRKGSEYANEIEARIADMTAALDLLADWRPPHPKEMSDTTAADEHQCTYCTDPAKGTDEDNNPTCGDPTCTPLKTSDDQRPLTSEPSPD